MKTSKSVFGKMAAVALLIVTLLSLMVVPVSAATSSGSITVTTCSDWGTPGRESITISQSKGIRTHALTHKEKERYGKWTVSYVNVDNPKDRGSRTLSGKSVKLNLGRDKTYTVTVTWDSMADLSDASWYGPFTTDPEWWVSATCKASYS